MTQANPGPAFLIYLAITTLPFASLLIVFVVVPLGILLSYRDYSRTEWSVDMTVLTLATLPVGLAIGLVSQLFFPEWWRYFGLT